MRAAALREQGYEVLPVVVDVSDEASVDQMVAAARASYGTIDILVNNAGIGVFKGLEEETFEEWKRVLDVNLTGVHLCTRKVFDIMKEKGSGKIISMGSLGGQVGGMKVTPGYVASKAGVMGGHQELCPPRCEVRYNRERYRAGACRDRYGARDILS